MLTNPNYCRKSWVYFDFYSSGLTQFAGDTLQFTRRWRGFKPRQHRVLRKPYPTA